MQVWNKFDPSMGDEVIQPIDEDEVVKFEETIPEGAKLILVKTEEVWCTDPENGTDAASILLSQRGFIRRPDPQEQKEILAMAEMNGILATALSSHFN